MRIGQLDCGTTYTVGVEAYDAAGNHSDRTSIQTGTISGCHPYIGGGRQAAAPATASAPASTPPPPPPAGGRRRHESAVGAGGSFADGRVGLVRDVVVDRFDRRRRRGRLRLVRRGRQDRHDRADELCLLRADLRVELHARRRRLRCRRQSFSGLDADRHHQRLHDDTAAGGGDTSPPTAPTNLSQTAVSDSTATLSWNASTDDVGVTGYGLYVGGIRIDTTSQTSYAFSGLSCASNYTLGVDAYDAAGNRSPVSTLIVTTSACPAPPPPPPSGDTSPPTAPTNLSQSASTTSSVTASWTASTDNVGVTGYDVLVDGTQSGTTATTSYTVTGLSCGTSHQVVVDAFDAAGNHSPQASATMTTSACPAAATRRHDRAVDAGLACGVGDDGVEHQRFVGGVERQRRGDRLRRVQQRHARRLADGDELHGEWSRLWDVLLVAVDAYDAAGNRSGKATVSSATAACADTQAPTAPVAWRS